MQEYIDKQDLIKSLDRQIEQAKNDLEKLCNDNKADIKLAYYVLKTVKEYVEEFPTVKGVLL